MQIIKVSAQGQDEYYVDFKLAFHRWLELDGEDVFFEVLEVITSLGRDANMAGDEVNHSGPGVGRRPTD